MIAADLVVRRIGLLATLAGPAPRTGAAMRDLGLARDAALAVAGGRIAWVGPDAGFDAAVVLRPGAETLDAGGAAVVPGPRRPPHPPRLRRRPRRRDPPAPGRRVVRGDRGGGRRDRAHGRGHARGVASRSWRASSSSRLDEMLLCGTTTAEVKSGYGLETGAEIRSLEAIRHAAARHPVTVVPTFLGAHEVPREHRANRARYVDILVEEMIPAVAARGLAVSPTSSARRASSRSRRAGGSCSPRGPTA